MRTVLLKRLIKNGLLLVGIISLSSCATILAGKKNTLKVHQGYPESAQVFLDGKYMGDAPFNQRISKFELQEGSLIEIKKEGFATYKYEVIRSPHVIYVMADILTGVIPLVVDVADANIYRPNTRNIKYHLKPVDPVNSHANGETLNEVE
ncbi:MAG: hypothetical protein K9G61_08020 [Bacteroidales bacterium]|nr:hypothetical protein [Bacteroidales bacterium]